MIMLRRIHHFSLYSSYIMRLFTLVTAWLFLLFSSSFLIAQTFTGTNAAALVPGAEKVTWNEALATPSAIRFTETARMPLAEYLASEKEMYGLASSMDFRMLRENSDANGNLHLIRQQYYQGMAIEGAISSIHVKQGKVVSANGALYAGLTMNINGLLEETEAYNRSLTTMNIDAEQWQYLKFATHYTLPDPDRSPAENDHFELLIDFIDGKAVPVWRLHLSSETLQRREVINLHAQTGVVLGQLASGKHEVTHNGSVKLLKYPQQEVHEIDDLQFGNRRLLTNSVNRYRARTSNTGQLVSTMNSIWNQSEATAFFGLQETLRAYSDLFERENIDGRFVSLVSAGLSGSTEYISPINNGDHIIRYKTKSSGQSDDETTLDFISHEFSHGITESVGWSKQNNNSESDALIESFCDIMGQMTQWYFEDQKGYAAYPDANSADEEWTIGEDITNSFSRNFRSTNEDTSYESIDVNSSCCDDPGGSDPGDMSCCPTETHAINTTQSPDTYGCGNFNTPGNNEYRLGGVLRHWFYLLSAGGSGTNSCGDEYEVCGIGVELAAKLVYETVANGHLPNTQPTYAQFRAATINARLFVPGVNSLKLNDAWYAVGVGVEPLGNITNGQVILSDDAVEAEQDVDITSYLIGRNIDDEREMCYFLSTDQTLSSNDVPLGSIDIEFDCDYSQTDRFDHTITIPEGTEQGDYYIILDAGCGDRTNESNWNDNIISIYIQVLGDDKDECGAELIITNPSPAYDNFPPTFLQGNFATVSAEVLNQGLQIAESFYIYTYVRQLATLQFPPSTYRNEQLAATGPPTFIRFVPGLGINQSFSFSHSGQIAANASTGEYVVFFVADARQPADTSIHHEEVCEFNEDNNVSLGHYIVRYSGGGGGGEPCKFPCRPKIVDGTTDVKPFFSLAPNPVRAGANVTIGYAPSLTEGLSINIVDVNGRPVSNFYLLPQQQTGQFSAGLQRLPAGVYVVRLSSGDQLISQRLIVQ